MVGIELEDFVRSEKERIISEIVATRHERGLTQERVASSMGFKQSMVARIETNHGAPRIDTLLRMLAALGKTLAVVDIDAPYEGDE